MGLHQRHNSSGNVRRATSPANKQHVIPQKDQDKLPKPRQNGSPNVCTRSKVKSKSKSHTGQTVKKPAAGSHRSLVDDELDFDKQFDKGRCSSDDDDCTWLSAGTSPSTFFRQHRLSGASNVDGRLVSWLSKLADSYLSFSGKAEANKSEENIAEDAGPQCTEKILQQGLKEDLDGILLWNSSGHAEGTGAWTWSSCEDHTSCGNPLTPLCSHRDSSSQVSDSERTNSVITLPVFDTERINSTVSMIDKEYHLDDLPSSSSKSIWCSEDKLIDIPHVLVKPASHTELRSEAVKERDCNNEEPIFWPFDQSWSSDESWTYFSMSPRKDRLKISSLRGFSSRFIGSEHCDRHLQTQNRCQRRLVFNSVGSNHSEYRNRNDNIQNTSSVQRENSCPSKLKESTKASMKVVPLDSEDHIIDHGHGNPAMPTSVFSSRNFLEDDFSSNQELPIETLVGLGEFDGHEGIDSDVYEDTFVLDEFR